MTDIYMKQIQVARIRRALNQRITQAVSILTALESDTYNALSAREDLFYLCEDEPDDLIPALENLAYEGEEQ